MTLLFHLQRWHGAEGIVLEVRSVYLHCTKSNFLRLLTNKVTDVSCLVSPKISYILDCHRERKFCRAVRTKI